jgi:hypothetical protein
MKGGEEPEKIRSTKKLVNAQHLISRQHIHHMKEEYKL